DLAARFRRAFERRDPPSPEHGGLVLTHVRPQPVLDTGLLPLQVLDELGELVAALEVVLPHVRQLDHGVGFGVGVAEHPSGAVGGVRLGWGVGFHEAPELVRAANQLGDDLLITVDDACDEGVGVDERDQVGARGASYVHGPVILEHVLHRRFVVGPCGGLAVVRGLGLDHAVQLAVGGPGEAVDVDAVVFGVGDRVGAGAGADDQPGVVFGEQAQYDGFELVADAEPVAGFVVVQRVRVYAPGFGEPELERAAVGVDAGGGGDV